MRYYLSPSSTYPKPYNFNAAFFCLGEEFNLGWVALLVFLPQPMVFTYGVNSTLNRVNTVYQYNRNPKFTYDIFTKQGL